MHFSTFANDFFMGVTSKSEPEAKKASLKVAEIVGRNLGIHGVIEFNRDGRLVLGGGSFGVAGISAEDTEKVVKLTTDPEEVAAASVLVGKMVFHIVSFFEAALISKMKAMNINTGVEQPVGITVAERLDRVGCATVEGGRELNRIVDGVKREFGVEADAVIHMPPTVAKRRLMKAAPELVSRLRLSDINDLVEIAEGVEELMSFGIHAVDFHRGNVGFSDRDGVYKIFDIGLSSIKKSAKPKVLLNPDGVEWQGNPGMCWPTHPISLPERMIPVLY